MANRYWVGGTATWNTSNTANWSASSGGPSGASVPTAADSVFFDQTGPYTVTTAGALTCLDFTVSVASISFTGSGSLTISGSMFLASGTPTFNASISGITFNSTVAGRTINTNGATIGNPSVVLNGVGGSWTLGSSYISNNTFTVTNGTFNTANFGMVIGGSFNSSNSNTRTINLGTSTIDVNVSWNTGVTTGLTFSGASSTINFSSPSTTFIAGGFTYGTVNFTNTSPSSLTINGANTFSTLSFAARAASGFCTLSLGANQTVTTSFSVQSGATDPTRRLFIVSSTIGTARTITSASNTIFGADFRDITGAGAASWSDSSRTNYWGDCKGNSGITFATGRSAFWNLAGAQNWSATGWALTSTGTPAAANFPLAQDTATFTDAGSVTGTITVNASWNIGTLDMSNRTSAMFLQINAAILVYGNWLNGTGLTMGSNDTLTFAGRNTQSITSAGIAVTPTIIINSIGGTVQLVDALTLSLNNLILTAGTFTTNNQTLNLIGFNSSNSNTRTLTLGTSTINLSGTGTVWTIATTTGITLNSGTANIVLTDNSTAARTFTAGQSLNYAGTTITIGGTTSTSTTTFSSPGGSYGTISSTKTVAHTILFNTGTQSIANFTVTGTPGNIVTVNSTLATSQSIITYTGSGIISMDYMSIRDINFSYTLGASNPYLVYAGANSTNGGNNNGILFQPTTVKAYRLTTGTSWTTPADWNNASNTIHMIGAGGGGATSAVSGNNRAAGGGGGGGGYTVLTNQTLTGAIPYTIGTSAGNGNGGNTTFNTTNTAGGGLAGTATTVPLSTGGSGGTGVTFNGGNGGAGSFGTAASTGYGAGSGGGAGGVNGVGGNGGSGFGSSTTANLASGGGGGNGGGSAGGNAASATFGTGGNNFGGTGGGATNGASGTFGGGGAGGVNATTGGNGGSGIDIANTIGGGGGKGGGSSSSNITANTGLYGGGGGGSGVTTAGGIGTGGAGSQGVIFIVYTPSGAPVANSNFFLMFG
jgi:hypothetical protein